MDEHAPRVATLPGVRRICFNLVEMADGAPDGVSELWLDSPADFDAAYASEIGKAVAADSMVHVKCRSRLLVTEYEVSEVR